MRRLLAASLVAGGVFATLMPPAAHAADEPPPRVQVADPYLELHTGPGRGYPVFHVAARHEWVEILLRHTDWFRVRAQSGREGWVSRAQMENTLLATGGRTFRDVLVDEVLRRRLEFGAGYGRFKSEPMLKVWAGWRVADAFSLEATVGQVQGLFSGTDFWHLNLNVEPFNDRPVSPFLAIGVGKFRNFPNTSLVGAVDTRAKLGDALLGVRWRFSERFVARVDYGLYTAYVSDARSTEYRAATLGLSFSF